MNTNEELIARAREVTAHRCVDAPEQECGQHGDEYSRLMSDLADALEVATTKWEYGHEGDTLVGVHVNASLQHALEDAEHLTRYWEPHGKVFRAVRRRAAGRWEPITNEGVKP